MTVWIKLIKRTKLPDITVVLTDFVVIADSFRAQSQISILTKVNTGQFWQFLFSAFVICYVKKNSLNHKKTDALHASAFGANNWRFFEIPAIEKNSISGFAKCGRRPLSADHAKAILVRTANFADIRIICTFLTNIIREKAKTEPSYTIYTSDVFRAGFWGLTKKDSLPVRTTLIWCSLVFILVVFLTWTRKEPKDVVFRQKCVTEE